MQYEYLLSVVFVCSMLTLQHVRCRPTEYDPLVLEGNRSLCNRTDTQTYRFNVSMALVANVTHGLKFARRKHGAASVPFDLSKRIALRRKRSWIFPGTLWCGTGSKAIGYEELGMFENADRCCREHDQCMHVIPAFTVNYGVFNPNFFTVSHCDCDQRFRQCLLNMNDTISNMVGYSFFTILRVPCFVLIQQRQCAKMYWWGMCKVAKEAPYAVFQNPHAYNTTRNTSKHGDTWDNHNSTRIEGYRIVENSLNRKPPKGENSKPSISSHNCSQSGPPRGDTFHKKRKGKGCKRSSKTFTSPEILTSMAHTAIASTVTVTASPVLRTTPLSLQLTTTLRNVSKIKTTTSISNKLNKRKAGRVEKTPYAIHTVPSQVATKPLHKTSSTTQSTPPITQRAALNLQTTMAPITITTKIYKQFKQFKKKYHHCGTMMPVRGDSFQHRRKHCLEQRHYPQTTAIIATTSMTVLPKQVTTAQTPKPNKKSVSHKRNSSISLWFTSTTLPMRIKQKPGTLLVTTIHPLRDIQLLCGTLKNLDECKYRIPPLEKKYDVQNNDSKIAYHCNCTSRLAVQIEHLKMPKIIPSLLMDFVSQYCFELPNEETCHSKKSCSAGFYLASGLFKSLKNLEEKDPAGVQNSGKEKKRRIPVHLYKRCMKIIEPVKRGLS